LSYFAINFSTCFFAELNIPNIPFFSSTGTSALNSFISVTNPDSKSPTSPELFVLTSFKTLSENFEILLCALEPNCNIWAVFFTSTLLINSSIADFSSGVKAS